MSTRKLQLASDKSWGTHFQSFGNFPTRWRWLAVNTCTAWTKLICQFFERKKQKQKCHQTQKDVFWGLILRLKCPLTNFINHLRQVYLFRHSYPWAKWIFWVYLAVEYLFLKPINIYLAQMLLRHVYVWRATANEISIRLWCYN